MNEKEFILTSLLDCNRSDLYTKDVILNNDIKYRLSEIFQARRLGEPLQYILGKTEFMGLDFKVTRDTFIPRPETEILVEKTIELIKKSYPTGIALPTPLKEGAYPENKIRILDLCTGSGCIAISLAKYLSSAMLIASDISEQALKVAKENAKLNKVNKKIKFVKSDLFNNVNGEFDLIVTNPPYVVSFDINNLQPELRYEPRIALNGGGKDGLDFYRKIIKKSPVFLKKDGTLIMEMGFGQSQNIKNLLKKQEKFKILDIIKDYQDIERIVIIKYHG